MKLDLLWPILQKHDNKKQNEELTHLQQRGINKKRFSIRGQEQNNQKDQIVLEELRRLYDQEIDRRASADNKAGIYIASITALLSILVPLLPNILKFDKVTFSSTLSYIFIFLSLCGLFRAAYWSNKVIGVSKYFVLGWQDILRAGNSKNTTIRLIEEILISLVRNYELNNEKVTSIKMTQALMISASFWLLIFAVFQVLSFIVSNISGRSDDFSEFFSVLHYEMAYQILRFIFLIINIIVNIIW